jgi:hypothetical protein
LIFGIENPCIIHGDAKAPIDKDNRVILRQYNIRLAKIVFIIFPEAESSEKQVLPDSLFRLGIAVPDFGHVLASRLF